MKSFNEDDEFSTYFSRAIPSEIKAGDDDIFYREKYHDILNYLKIMLTNNEDTILQQFLRPTGALLVKVNSGTDIMDFLRTITKNYDLELFESEIEIVKESVQKQANEIISNLNTLISIETSLEKGERSEVLESSGKPGSHVNKIIIIDQTESLNVDGNTLLRMFINNQRTSSSHKFLIEKGILLIWLINKIEDVEENSDGIFEIFDLFVNIPLLSDDERELILRNYSENNPAVVFDINAIAEITKGWEVKSILGLIKTGILKHFLNSSLNKKSNEITNSLINLIESKEFIPLNPVKNINNNSDKAREETAESNRVLVKKESNSETRVSEAYIGQIRDDRISDFMLKQLYEEAASKNYNEISIILDKLGKKEHLEENERKLLASYSFILNDNPKMAQVHLEKAKKRIDDLINAFGR